MSAFEVTTSATRPANTTAYAALDVMGDGTSAVMSFPGLGNRSQNVLITSAVVRFDTSSIPAGLDDLRLHLYKNSPASALADNAAFDLPSGDRADYIGFIDFDTVVDLGATLIAQADSVNKHVTLQGATSSTIYGYLQTIAGFTPASAVVQTVTLRAIEL